MRHCQRPGTQPLAMPTQYWGKEGPPREPKPRLREDLAGDLALCSSSLRSDCHLTLPGDSH